MRFLVDRRDERFCFRLHRDRVFYLSERMMRLAASFPRKYLTSAGTCFGKFTKSGKFHLKVTCLEYLAQYAKVSPVRALPAQACRATLRRAREQRGVRRTNTPMQGHLCAWDWLNVPGRPRSTRRPPALAPNPPAPQHKVWVKPSSEMTFLYGNHIIKAGVQRITEDMPQYAGVVVLSMSNAPLGFGVAAHPAERLKDLDGTAVAVLHQSDVGEYLREEESLT